VDRDRVIRRCRFVSGLSCTIRERPQAHLQVELRGRILPGIMSIAMARDRATVAATIRTVGFYVRMAALCMAVCTHSRSWKTR
jgi:hypothetical protein